MVPHILIVDDDFSHLSMLKTIINDWGYSVGVADDGSSAVRAIKEKSYDLVLMDVRMAQLSGIEALKQIKEYNPSIPVLIMTAYSSVDTAVEALKLGAYDYLTKPLDFEVLKLTLKRALDHVRLEIENRALRQKLPQDFDLVNIVGKSPAMKKLIETVAMVAPTEATVLITGESGTGKELIAKAIHYNSARKNGPLVTVNCAALSETLLESELFGHEKGAFTGADRRREGRFAQANKGTIFLDEIGELSPSMQAKLLRVIQEREIQRVGSDKAIFIDVRIVAATNRDLKKEVEENNFREDLFYRLNVVALEAPPLRGRKDDIPLLAKYFLDRFTERNRKNLIGFTPKAMDALLRYDWPGNVRELENAVERAVILSSGEYVTDRDLPPSLVAAAEPPPTRDAADQFVGQSLEEVKRHVILATLEQANGNKSEAARVLGITRATLLNQLKKFKLTHAISSPTRSRVEP